MSYAGEKTPSGLDRKLKYSQEQLSKNSLFNKNNELRKSRELVIPKMTGLVYGSKTQLKKYR